MEYTRVKITYAGTTGGQIMTESEFALWLKETNIQAMVKSGYSFSISPVKKSPLLTSKKKS